jgi:ABC-type Fe3+-hydroxamate transport system substrate-binding protein
LHWKQALTKQNGDKMNKTILTLACATIAPIAFAQTSNTTTTQTTTAAAPVVTNETTTTTYSAGTVSTYEPSKTIIVKDESGGPVRFALGTAARIVNKAGDVVTTAIKPGQRVRVYYTGTGEKRVVERVIVED